MTSLYIISMTWVTDINLANQLEGKNIGYNEVKKKASKWRYFNNISKAMYEFYSLNWVHSYLESAKHMEGMHPYILTS